MKLSFQSPYEAYGVQCGKGWAKIYEPLLLVCEEEEVKVMQVKEKMGGLRFYIETTDNDLLHELIDNAEIMSFHTCEECGKPGITRKGGWMKTLCDTCNEARLAV